MARSPPYKERAAKRFPDVGAGGTPPNGDPRRQQEAVVADLHDRVIQRIFRAGLVLQGGDVSDGALAAAVAELDAALCDIRSTKYGLQVQRPVGDVGMQAEPGTDTCPGGGDSGADPSMPFVVDSSGVVAVAGR